MYHEATPRARYIVSRDGAKALPGQRTPKEFQQAYSQCGGLAPLWPEARMRLTRCITKLPQGRVTLCRETGPKCCRASALQKSFSKHIRSAAAWRRFGLRRA